MPKASATGCICPLQKNQPDNQGSDSSYSIQFVRALLSVQSSFSSEYYYLLLFSVAVNAFFD